MEDPDKQFGWPSGRTLGWCGVIVYVVIAVILGVYFRWNGGF